MAGSLVIKAVFQPILSVTLLPEIFRLSWPTNGGGEWMLESKTNLLDADWMLVTNVPVSNPIDVSIDPDIAPVFYRLELQ